MTAQQIIDLLNEALALDPAAIHALVDNRVPANDRLLEHPTIMCNVRTGNNHYPTIGMLGIINAIAQVDNEIIEAEYNKATNCLIRLS